MDEKAQARLAAKIKNLRTSLGLSQVEFGKLVGAGDNSLVSKWERGLQRPNSERNAKLAELAGQTIGEWMELAPLRKRDAKASVCRVVADLRAGDWREAIEWHPDDQFEVTVPNAPDMPLLGYVVRGNSMNRLYPDGTLVFAASTIANRMRPKPGQRVIVQRRNRDGLYEATLKEYVVDENGKAWLWPRSTDPEHQAPVPYGGKGDEEVTITGVVMASWVFEAL